MTDLDKLQEMVVQFRDERNWKQFHNPKDLAISLVLEATEFLEHFQWKTEEEIKQHLKTKKDDVAEELADVLYWVLLIANDLDIPINDTFVKKMIKNQAKYPINKAKGKHTKYTEL
jgi:NTP pyrophosphatase (non-canonical NTP hydrolase)